mmetsp:Transcript_21150/g.68950  ORF Transcript_21150/g.68950 Transcript_21150/m.68950 type:complete len:204 (-) Transcript_21150:181-792(-)
MRQERQSSTSSACRASSRSRPSHRAVAPRRCSCGQSERSRACTRRRVSFASKVRKWERPEARKSSRATLRSKYLRCATSSSKLSGQQRGRAASTEEASTQLLRSSATLAASASQGGSGRKRTASRCSCSTPGCAERSRTSRQGTERRGGEAEPTTSACSRRASSSSSARCCRGVAAEKRGGPSVVRVRFAAAPPPPLRPGGAA